MALPFIISIAAALSCIWSVDGGETTFVQDLGRGMRLGSLYNIHNDKVVTGTIWNDMDIMNHRRVTNLASTDMVMTTSDKMEDKAALTDVSGSLLLSVLSYNMKLNGAGQLLRDFHGSTRASTAHFSSKVSLFEEEFTAFFDNLDITGNLDEIKKRNATHVVTAVQWGAQCTASFSKLKEDNNKQISWNVEVGIMMDHKWTSTSAEPVKDTTTEEPTVTTSTTTLTTTTLTTTTVTTSTVADAWIERDDCIQTVDCFTGLRDACIRSVYKGEGLTGTCCRNCCMCPSPDRYDLATNTCKRLCPSPDWLAEQNFFTFKALDLEETQDPQDDESGDAEGGADEDEKKKKGEFKMNGKGSAKSEEHEEQKKMKLTIHINCDVIPEEKIGDTVEEVSQFFAKFPSIVRPENPADCFRQPLNDPRDCFSHAMPKRIRLTPLSALKAVGANVEAAKLMNMMDERLVTGITNMLDEYNRGQADVKSLLAPAPLGEPHGPFPFWEAELNHYISESYKSMTLAQYEVSKYLPDARRRDETAVKLLEERVVQFQKSNYSQLNYNIIKWQWLSDIRSLMALLIPLRKANVRILENDADFNAIRWDTSIEDLFLANICKTLPDDRNIDQLIDFARFARAKRTVAGFVFAFYHSKNLLPSDEGLCEARVEHFQRGVRQCRQGCLDDASCSKCHFEVPKPSKPPDSLKVSTSSTSMRLYWDPVGLTGTQDWPENVKYYEVDAWVEKRNTLTSVKTKLRTFMSANSIEVYQSKVWNYCSRYYFSVSAVTDFKGQPTKKIGPNLFGLPMAVYPVDHYGVSSLKAKPGDKVNITVWNSSYVDNSTCYKHLGEPPLRMISFTVSIKGPGGVVLRKGTGQTMFNGGFQCEIPQNATCSDGLSDGHWTLRLDASRGLWAEAVVGCQPREEPELVASEDGSVGQCKMNTDVYYGRHYHVKNGERRKATFAEMRSHGFAVRKMDGSLTKCTAQAFGAPGGKTFEGYPQADSSGSQNQMACYCEKKSEKP